ncbi:MAG: AEC family transporter, partial [Hyphomicrobiales bacterium]
MEILQVLSDPILPVFAIMAFGFGMGRAGKSSVDDARLLNRFAMSILLPIFVFGLIANTSIQSFSLAPILIYLLTQIVIF